MNELFVREYNNSVELNKKSKLEPFSSLKIEIVRCNLQILLVLITQFWVQPGSCGHEFI